VHTINAAGAHASLCTPYNDGSRMPLPILRRDGPPAYDDRIFPFMRRKGEQKHITESSVSIPPALHITDSEGAVWTLGFDYSEAEWRTGKHEYDVVRNGRVTGAFARIIEYGLNSKNTRVVKIFGSEGWRHWNGRAFV
jgi:hypothetical protein